MLRVNPTLGSISEGGGPTGGRMVPALLLLLFALQFIASLYADTVRLRKDPQGGPLSNQFRKNQGAMRLVSPSTLGLLLCWRSAPKS